MGDAADAVIEGACCESCGEFFDDDGWGCPRTCEGCQNES